MTPKHERKLLQQLLKQLDHPLKQRRRGSELLINLLLWVVTFCIMLVFFQFGPTAHWTDALLGGTCLGVGLLIAYGVYKSMHQAQWPVVSRYMDKAQIEARLRELGA